MLAQLFLVSVGMALLLAPTPVERSAEAAAAAAVLSPLAEIFVDGISQPPFDVCVFLFDESMSHPEDSSMPLGCF
jgi:hypothetical protein